ncbi:MAG TPA: type II toxin-antitoxin system VapC family toxin [Holophaga sp.]|nr:type II toxin-antitoxin system VapC family toxin [Holophaga sp.]
MLYLLDTNFLVELRRRNPLVIARLRRHDPGALAYSVVSLGEIQRGVVRHPPETARAMWQAWARLLEAFAQLDFTASAALVWGRLLHETRRRQVGPRDLLIAATALVGGMTVVTHNTREFTRIGGLAVEDWQA